MGNCFGGSSRKEALHQLPRLSLDWGAVEGDEAEQNSKFVMFKRRDQCLISQGEPQKVGKPQ